MEEGNKQKVQDHIGDGGDDQVIQRMLRIPHRLKNAHKNVVHDKEQGTRKVNLKIDFRVWKNFRRGSHEEQDLRSQEYTENAKKDACCQAKGNGGVDGILEMFYVTGAEITGDDYTSTDCHAIEEAHHEKDQVSGGTDSCQGVAAKKVSNDQGIGHVVQLLKKVSKKKGDGKGDDPFPDGAVRHQSVRRMRRHKNSDLP